MSRRVLFNLIFFNVIFGVMLLWAVNNIVTLDAVERPYTIHGDFDQAAGVSADSEVTYLGVNYGRVSGVDRREGGVRVTMKIQRDKHIPAGSTARIFRKSAIGEPYVDFAPPDPFVEDEFIEEGEVVERTTVPLEFSELLRSASALVGSIDPEQAGSLVHELALALDGRAQDLRDLTTSFDTLSATFATRTDQLDRLAENNTRITRVLADHRLSIGRSLTNLRAVGESLRDARGDLSALLRDGPEFLTTTADLVADQKQNLDCLLTDLAPVLRMASSDARIADLETLLREGPTGFGLVFSALDRDPDGPWIRVHLELLTPGAPPPVYSPPRSLPVVPTVSACSSTLVPAGVTASGSSSAGTGTTGAAGPATGAPARATARPGTAGDVVREAGDLATTGGEPLAALALVLLAGAAALLQTQRWRTGRGAA
jgi:phospholipid/cholesterol/gamma-HCH transport system substrate-binding protein